ncbi:MAG: Clp protease ClpP [Oscillospiraceae bacterium]|nr:Clp protease ClpP [Oscillospiraceae bacterium]
MPKRIKKFWNVASVSDNEGEITLYGDVVSSQPIDWWTGEPEPGNYISPEGFLSDLEQVKNKGKVTVRLNSCGGDLYTGIAIHNALKQLTGTVNVIVEGMAASAASVIMCAGDTVSVMPGSIVMIHGVKVGLSDYYGLPDLKQIQNSVDANERAVAAIYAAKTGTDTDTLRNMMSCETWMVGQEAIDNGFADEMLEGNPVQMSLSGNVLLVNGIRHNVTGLHLPERIHNMSRSVAFATGNIAKEKTEEVIMNENELREKYPDIVAQIEANAQTAPKPTAEPTVPDTQNAAQEAAQRERERLEAIDKIAPSIGDTTLITEAKYGKTACTAEQLAFRVLEQAQAAGENYLVTRNKELTNAGGTAKVTPAAPPADTEAAKMKSEAGMIAAARPKTK